MPRTREQDRIYQRERRAKRKAEKAAERLPEPIPPTVEAPSGPREYEGRHTRAVKAMIDATGLDQLASEAPLVELVKVLARDLDNGGEGGTISQYRAALNDIRRVVSMPAAKPKTPAAEEPPAPTRAAPLNDLARFKAKRGIS